MENPEQDRLVRQHLPKAPLSSTIHCQWDRAIPLLKHFQAAFHRTLPFEYPEVKFILKIKYPSWRFTMHINFLWALRSPALNILVNFSEPNICLTLFHHGTISFVPSINIPRRVRSLRTQYLNCYSRVKNYSLHRPFFFGKRRKW